MEDVKSGWFSPYITLSIQKKNHKINTGFLSYIFIKTNAKCLVTHGQVIDTPGTCTVYILTMFKCENDNYKYSIVCIYFLTSYTICNIYIKIHIINRISCMRKNLGLTHFFFIFFFCREFWLNVSCGDTVSLILSGVEMSPVGHRSQIHALNKVVNVP